MDLVQMCIEQRHYIAFMDLCVMKPNWLLEKSICDVSIFWHVFAHTVRLQCWLWGLLRCHWLTLSRVTLEIMWIAGHVALSVPSGLSGGPLLAHRLYWGWGWRELKYWFTPKQWCHYLNPITAYRVKEPKIVLNGTVTLWLAGSQFRVHPTYCLKTAG